MKNNSNSQPSKNKSHIKNILTIGLFSIMMISLFTNGLFMSQAMASDNTTSVANNTSASLDNTSVTVTANQNIISAGGQVTLIATVTDSSSSPTTPMGSISWNDGNGGGTFSSAFCNLSSGTCTVSYTTSTVSQNSIAITATYGGDATHQTSSGTLSLSVLTMHPTSVSVSPNSASFVSGTAIVFTTTITDTSSSPTSPSGIVSWSDGNAGGTFSSSVCTLSSGTCTTTYTPSSGSPNSIAITASYGGDSAHQTSSGTSQLSQSTQDAASVLITSSASTVSSGGQVTVTATVTDTTNSQNTPTGTITWSDGNVGGTFSSSSCNLSSGTCSATYTASSSVQNSITITASYGGDSIHTTNSGTLILTTNSLSPTSVTVSPNPSAYSPGDTLTFTATVTDTTNSQNTPTGTITWSDGNVGGTFSSSSCNLSSGTCNTTYIPSTNSPSTVTITASYGGDSAHQTSSGISSLTINTVHATTLSVTPNPATVSPGGSVTFTATVTDSSNSPIVPTSSVSWSDGNGGGVFDQTSCTLSSGSCTVTYTPSANPPNAITITASYNGDNDHQASTGSSQLSPNVLHATTTTVTPNPATLSSGTQITFTATITDTTDASSSMIGIVKWTDNGAGGSFSPDACIVSNNHCALEYTPPLNPRNSITITASYAGDSTHSASSATSLLSTSTTSPSTNQPSTTQSTPTQSPSTQSSSTQPNTSPSNQPSTTQSTPTQSPSTQSSSTTSTPKSNTSPSSQSSTTQSTPTTHSTSTQPNTEHNTQSSSNNPTPQPSTNSNQKSQPSPLSAISQTISKVVSELETLFKKL